MKSRKYKRTSSRKFPEHFPIRYHLNEGHCSIENLHCHVHADVSTNYRCERKTYKEVCTPLIKDCKEHVQLCYREYDCAAHKECICRTRKKFRNLY